MQRIYKYEVPTGAEPGPMPLPMPRGAKILSVGTQKTLSQTHLPHVELGAVLWAAVDPDAPVVNRFIATFPTGHTWDVYVPTANFIATVQLDHGIVMHVFDFGEHP